MNFQAYGALHVVEALDIESLPRGHVSRLLVDIGHDGLGASMRLPVLVARGERSGPVFGVTAAVHGDELNGIPVIHRLFAKLDPKVLRGTLVAVLVVNLPGFHAQERQFNDRRDLNHLMPGRPDGDSAEVYAHRLIRRLVRHFDYLVDMHTASFGRINSLYVRADMTHESTAQMAYLLRPQIIVHNPASDGTLRGAAMAMGIPSVTLEIGNPLRFQAHFIQRSLAGLRTVLADVKMIPKRKVALGTAPVLCERSLWCYTNHGGLLEVMPEVTDMVEADEPIGRLTNIFGDPVSEYRAPLRGVVIGKSVNPVGRTGARILHLGIEAPEGHPFHVRR